MYVLDRSELQEAVMALEVRLHMLQGEAERSGRYDEELPNTRTALNKLRKQLELTGMNVGVCC